MDLYLAGLFAALLGSFAVLGVTVFLAERERKRRPPKPPQTSLDEKLTRILEMSQELNRLNKEAQTEFDLQIAATREAQSDAEQAVRLASLSAEQREAAERMVAVQIEGALSKSIKKDRKFQVLIAVAAFFAGIAASIIGSIIISWLSA